MGLKQLLHTQTGGYIISIVLGLGLASLFRKACQNRKCMKFEAPSSTDIEKYVYHYDDPTKCFKYDPHITKCDAKKQIISIN